MGPLKGGGPGSLYPKTPPLSGPVCQEFQDGERFLVPWSIQRATDDTFVAILFTIDGVSTEPDGVAGDITATGDLFPNVTGLTYRSNLTIAVFIAQYDGSSIRCGAPTSPYQRTFNFGFPSKYWKWSSGMITVAIEFILKIIRTVLIIQVMEN